jgi:serine/threonine-protein phosphatase 6 regulatory ankyrin repeat subunit B
VATLHSSGTLNSEISNCQLEDPLAIDWRDIKQVKKLLDDGKIGINDRHSFDGIGGWTALMIASRYGHTELVKFLLDKSAEVNLQNDKGWSALKNASYNNHNHVVELLLKQDVRPMVDLQDDHGWTALMNASRHGNYELAELLLKSGADPNIRRKSGRTALKSASGNGWDKVVTLLLKYNAEINVQDNDYGMTALMYAITAGHISVAKLLIAKTESADIDLSDNEGRSALIIASDKGHGDVVKFLLKKGAAVYKYNKNGVSALTSAKNCETAKLLLRQQPNVMKVKCMIMIVYNINVVVKFH